MRRVFYLNLNFGLNLEVGKEAISSLLDPARDPTLGSKASQQAQELIALVLRVEDDSSGAQIARHIDDVTFGVSEPLNLTD